MKVQKTIVEKFLDQKKIPHQSYSYPSDEFADGVTVAGYIDKPVEQVFKTLVTTGSKGVCVFVVPVAQELDLKKAAKAVGAKSIEMIKQKELLPLTGYIHGGCSPIGMKKAFPTVIDDTAHLFDEICVSAGRVGRQVKLSPTLLAELCCAHFADIADDCD